MRKKLLLSGAIITGILVLIILLKPNYDKRIEKILINDGYKYQESLCIYRKEYNGYMLPNLEKDIINKKNTSYEGYEFNINNYSLQKNVIKFYDGIKYDLNAVYSYKTESINYFFRINSPEFTIVIKGDNLQNELSCNLEYYHGILLNDESIYCDYVRNEMEDFNVQILDLFTQEKILNYMKQK